MTPHAALHSPVVQVYAAIVAGILLVAGLLLSRRPKDDPAWQAYRGWLILVPLAALAIILGHGATIAFFTVVGLLGFREFARASGLECDWHLTKCVAAGIILTGVVIWAPLGPAQSRYDLFMILPLLVTAGLLCIPILRNQARGQLGTLTLAIFAFLLIGWMFGHVALLANSTHAYAYLIYLLFAVEMSDVAAFLIGNRFGRHQLRSRISPGKTWEGAFGALLVSLALPWALWFTFPHMRPLDLLVTGLIVGIGGQVGDLVFSGVKREFGVKDLGRSIPGHGGILDRIDSLIYVAPLWYHYLRYCNAIDAPT